MFRTRKTQPDRHSAEPRICGVAFDQRQQHIAMRLRVQAPGIGLGQVEFHEPAVVIGTDGQVLRAGVPRGLPGRGAPRPAVGATTLRGGAPKTPDP